MLSLEAKLRKGEVVVYESEIECVECTLEYGTSVSGQMLFKI